MSMPQMACGFNSTCQQIQCRMGIRKLFLCPTACLKANDLLWWWYYKCLREKGIYNDVSVLLKSDLDTVAPGDSNSYFSSTFKLSSYQCPAKEKCICQFIPTNYPISTLSNGIYHLKLPCYTWQVTQSKTQRNPAMNGTVVEAYVDENL